MIQVASTLLQKSQSRSSILSALILGWLPTHNLEVQSQRTKGDSISSGEYRLFFVVSIQTNISNSVYSGTTRGVVQQNFGELEAVARREYVLPIFTRFLRKCYSKQPSCWTERISSHNIFQQRQNVRLVQYLVKPPILQDSICWMSTTRLCHIRLLDEHPWHLHLLVKHLCHLPLFVVRPCRLRLLIVCLCRLRLLV